MKHTYSISGMTCNGCRTGVEQKLNAVSGVENATVDLEKQEAVIEMKHDIPTSALQKGLPEKYTITESVLQQTIPKMTDSTNVFASAEPEKSKLAQLKPLLLIFLFISVAAVLLHKEDWDWQEMMLDFMGLFYVVFSFFKLLDLKGFPESFGMYDPLAKRVPFYGKLYPFIELALGVCFLIRFQIELSLVITLIILGITTIGVTKTLLDKKAIQCACLGTALRLPMTEATFIENTIMIVMALIMLIV